MIVHSFHNGIIFYNSICDNPALIYYPSAPHPSENIIQVRIQMYGS